MTLSIRPITAQDRADWDRLYQGYAAFYKVPQDDAMRDRVFSWLMDPAHGTKGFLAEVAGQVIGLTHYRPFVSPLRALTNCFLDDLFVDPAARGSGAAEALINAVKDVAKANGWATVRWITADDNYRGRGVYDKLADRTMWITYDLKVD